MRSKGTLVWLDPKAGALARSVARQRVEYNEKHRVNQSPGATRWRDDATMIQHHYTGNRGEIAVAFWLYGIKYFKPGVGQFHDYPDVKDVDVRTVRFDAKRRDTNKLNLRIYPRDKKEHPQVFVWDCGEYLHLRGWYVPEVDGLEDEWVTHYEGDKMWYVPTHRLRFPWTLRGIAKGVSPLVNTNEDFLKDFLKI